MKNNLCCYHKHSCKKIKSTSIDTYYKSLIDIYINLHDFLHDICLSKFAANDDVKTCKKCNNSKIIHWVCLNLHKDLDNHYK